MADGVRAAIFYRRFPPPAVKRKRERENERTQSERTQSEMPRGANRGWENYGEVLGLNLVHNQGGGKARTCRE